jgi:hypothetical protein
VRVWTRSFASRWKRLVHQVDLRAPDDGAPHGDALSLTAREIPGLAIEIRLEVEELRDLEHTLAALLLGHSLLLEREAHVGGDVELRIEGVVLEDHRDVAVARSHGRDVALGDQDPSRIERLDSGEHPQRGRLA